MNQTLIVGDVHGCIDELQELLRIVGLGHGDRLVFAGDLVAKGPDSAAVVQLARERGADCVRGNHEAHLLRYRQPDEGGRPLKPLHRSVAQSLSKADWSYVEAMPLWLRLPESGTLVVHAGLVPGVALEQQSPDWLMNLRSMRPDGEPSKKVADGTPWAAGWRGPEHIVFGHDALRGLQQYPFATGLDTGCVYGHKLSALLLPERRLVSVRAHRVWCDPKLPD